ncbi:hypothetical protein MKY96_33380 [Paenibacillus sp. FSL R7-0302]|uniref:hypothetical protein n=1 Tax=Paenibacillus sp. FSL R7-0302 TaxID=2921681 RepID=UPI0030F8E383
MKIYTPNEIFDELTRNISTFTHTAFAYSYMYYVTYLYRYCKFVESEKITQGDIKKKLGYSPLEKRIDYIVKKDGLLDKIGYTITTKDYPVTYDQDEFGQISFLTIEQLKEESGRHHSLAQRNYRIKYPIKSFHRTGESYNDRILDGTFYQVENTHRIDYSVFDAMMGDTELGVHCFYIYAYIKSRCDIYGAYQCPYSKMIESLNIKSYETFTKYIRRLEEAKFIEVTRVNHPNNRIANLYRVL